MVARQPIGTLLLAGGHVDREQLDAALAMQRQFGGRLGTNLIELGAIRVDPLAEQLARQLGVPAALKEHFVRADRKLLAEFPKKLAARYGVVPLSLSTGRGKTLSLAMIDPLDLAATDEIGQVLGCRIQAHVAPEARIQYILEKVWAIKPKRKTFIRMDLDLGRLKEAYAQTLRRDRREDADAARASLVPPAATRPASLAPARPAATVGAPRPRPARHPLPTHLEPPSMPAPPTATQPSLAAAPPAAVARDRAAAPPTPRFAPAARPPAANPAARTALPAKPEARSRRGAVTPRDEPHRLAPAEATRAATAAPRLTPAHARPATLHAISSATQRDEIASAVVDYAAQAYGCAILLLVKNGLALGWRGIAPGIDATTIEAILLPLGAPSVFATVFETGQPFRGPPPPCGEVLHERFWRLLRAPPPEDLLVVPVVMGTRVVQLLYVHEAKGRALPPAAGPDLLELVKAMADAFLRLIQKQRGE